MTHLASLVPKSQDQDQGIGCYQFLKMMNGMFNEHLPNKEMNEEKAQPIWLSGKEYISL